MKKVWKFVFSKPNKLNFSPPIKAHVSVSHIKTQHSYDFPLYFPREFFMNYIYIYIYIYLYLCIGVCICVYAYAYVCIHVYVHTQTCTYIRINAYTYT